MAVLPALVAVTVWVPAVVAVQLLAVQVPSGVIVKLVELVTSPSELPALSKASAL